MHRLHFWQACPNPFCEKSHYFNAECPEEIIKVWFVLKIFRQFGPLDSTNWVMEILPKAFRKKFHKVFAQFLNIEENRIFYQLNYLFLKMLHYSWRRLGWQPCKYFLWKSQKFRLKSENVIKSMKILTE